MQIASSQPDIPQAQLPLSGRSAHPPLDPALCLKLYRSRRVGAVTYHRLLSEYGGVDAALAALPEVAKAAGVDNYLACPDAVVEAEMAAGRKAGAKLLLRGTADYPALLSLIEDAPPVLWVKGDLSLLERPSLAVVGARNASSIGQRFTRSLCRELGEEGFCITSGLARGIDTAAHKAALEQGTIAVLAGGLDMIYPKENTDLYHKIAETGLLVSEHPFGMKPFARHFPMRNRIVAGLSKATIVVEAAARSGSLITAGMALDQGREVLAVPGHPFDGRSAGTNILIRDGASLVRGARDVVDALAAASPQARTRQQTPAEAIPIPAPAPETRSLAETSALHQAILAGLSGQGIEEDALIRAVDHDPDRTAAEILCLEIEGRITRKPGGLLALSGSNSGPQN